MSTPWGSLDFLRPVFLAGLALLPLYLILRWQLLNRAQTPYSPLQTRSVGRWAWAPKAQLVLEGLLVVLLVIGLAGPRRLHELELFTDEGIDVVLVLDVSLSMLAEDFPPNRLGALREIARDFVHRSGNNRLGVLIFAGDTYVQTPLTQHRGTVLAMLEGVTVDTINTSKSHGTAIGDALLASTEALVDTRFEGRDQAVILITDGENNTGFDPIEAAAYARHHGVRTYIVGVGAEEPVEVFYQGRRVGSDDQPYIAALDDAKLQAIADAADGQYFRASDVGALERIFGQLARLETAPLESQTVEIIDSFGTHLARASLPLFVGLLVFGGFILRRPLR